MVMVTSRQAETKAAMRCFMKSSGVSCHEVVGDFLASNKIARWCGVHPSVLLKTPKACEARIDKTNAIRARSA